MKVSRDQAARNRQRVIDAASRLFRARGVEGVGIGEVMRECGLTHGGFYNQFNSKEALAAEACAASLASSVDRWRDVAGHAGERSAIAAIAAIAADYLSDRNRDALETGCALVALGPDSARRGGALADAFRHGFEDLAAVLQQAGPDMDRPATLARMAQMVGAMVLARGVADAALSDEILGATRRALGVSG
jgi:TetR/AcrR family transcriptional repressor of nem operon